MKLNDTIIKLKVLFSLPLPFKNHFYKGHRISFKKKWFCTNCENVFDFKPWKLYKDKSMLEISCPNCGSSSIYHSDNLSKAIIDKKQTSELLNIINNININSAEIEISFNKQ